MLLYQILKLGYPSVEETKAENKIGSLYFPTESPSEPSRMSLRGLEISG
jgi:hypothetical protein